MIDAVAVWLEPAAGEDAKASLEAWARARGVKLVTSSEASEPAHDVAIDWSAGERVESEIAHAREALTGLDFDAAERALARATATLRDHAELPQAAWLRAEIERAWSSRWLRANDEARAKRAWQRAEGLDGGRAAGLGEKRFEADATVSATIRVEGESAGDHTLRLDGSAIAPGVVKRGEGEHALALVARDGSIAWADWVSLAEGAVVRVEAPDAPACSASDVGRARIDGSAVSAAHVRCAHWVAVAGAERKADGAPGAIRVATCEGETCGPLVEWRVTSSSSWTFAPGAVTPPDASARSPWPAWATWTLAGVGVAGAVVAIVVATGALKPAPTETHFVNGGLEIHSF